MDFIRIISCTRNPNLYSNPIARQLVLVHCRSSRRSVGDEDEAPHSGNYAVCSTLPGKACSEVIEFPEKDTKHMGFLALLLSLIFVHGGSLADGTV